MPTGKVRRLTAESGLTFTLYTPSSAYATLPSADAMAKALAHLAAREFVDAYVTPSNEVELVSTQPQRYKMFFDQPTLVFPQSFYQPGPWEVIKDDYLANAIDVLTRYAALTSANASGVPAYAQRLLDFEVALARQPYSASDSLRENFTRWNNLHTLGEANTLFGGLMAWNTWYEEMASALGLTDQLVPSDSTTVTAYFKEVDALGQLSADIRNASLFDPDVVVNYLFYRLLVANAPFIPPVASSAAGAASVQRGYRRLETRRQDFLHSGRGRRGAVGGFGRRSPLLEPFMPLDEDGARVGCVRQEIDLMTSANARVFTDLNYPTSDARDAIRQATNKIVQSIRHAMRSMLDELDWMDDASKVGAYAKVNDIQPNLAFPDYILDDTKLDAEYASLTIDLSQDSYFAALDKLTIFAIRLDCLQLVDGAGVDRALFVGPPSTINAWYDVSARAGRQRSFPISRNILN